MNDKDDKPEKNLQTSHCRSVFFVQFQAHPWNFICFYVQLLQHELCISESQSWQFVNYQPSYRSSLGKLTERQLIAMRPQLYVPSMFLRQAKLRPELMGYKVSSISIQQPTQIIHMKTSNSNPKGVYKGIRGIKKGRLGRGGGDDGVSDLSPRYW